MRRTVLSVATLAAAVLGWLLLAAPTTLGGPTTYVRVHGISMEPRFHTGDLAILRKADQYRTGDVVAYRSRLLGTTVMHRIVAARDGQYTFKGDNNSWLDPEHPTRDDLIGRLTVRVPHGGTWLARLASPPYLAGAAVLLLSTGGTTASRIRHRRKRRPMARHASRSSRPASLAALPPQLRAAAAVIAATAVLGAVLAALAWSGPPQTAVSVQQPSGRSMVFSYAATVPASAAYDTTTVTSPDPVFRKLTNTIRVRYAYTGGPGSLSLDAILSTPVGWRSTMAITPRTTFTTDRYQGSAQLNLDTLDARAQAAAAATGIPASQVDVAIVATITTAGAAFTPALHLSLTPLQLTLAGDGKGLTETDRATLTHTTWTPRALPVLGHHIGVTTARTLAVALLLVALFAAAVLLVLARNAGPANEAAAIRARYGSLLVPIHPMSTPPGQQIVDVTDFATLARLAERTGLLILHWSRSDVATFIIQDEATTYRYRSGSAGAAPDHIWLDVDSPIDA